MYRYAKKNTPNIILVDMYNVLTGESIKKFANRTEGFEKVNQALQTSKKKRPDWFESYLTPPPDETPKPKAKKKKAKPTKAAKAFDLHLLTAREVWVLYAMRACSEGRADCPLASLKEYLEADEQILDTVLKKLARNGCIQIDDTNLTSGSATIMPNAMAFLEEHHPDGAGISRVDMTKKDIVHPGKRSKYSGKRIYRLTKDNPRREGTHGWHSWNAITEDGMTYEDYLANRGRLKDLDYDVQKKFVEVK